MEETLRRPQDNNNSHVVKEEKVVESSSCVDEDVGEIKDNNSRPSSSNHKNSSLTEQDDKLEYTKAEMVEVRVENERLKSVLARITKDYQSLQMHFLEMVQQEQQTKKSSQTAPTHQAIIHEEPEFVSLSLGRTSSIDSKKDIGKTGGNSISKSKEVEEFNKGLSLGLDCSFEVSNTSLADPATLPSPDNSFSDSKDEVIEQWQSNKGGKTTRSGDDEITQQSPVKKPRVSVRTRCDTPTMNDGCQWRKYGQKISKGNPCPRAYYRCTVAQGCPVRKQVQRCAEDKSILITTYEGNHNHPLPIAATAMASTTSAAASMLLSGSSTSQLPLGGSTTTRTTTPANLHGLNFNLSSNSKQVYLPNSSVSSSSSYPTITLDLTTPSSPLSHLNRLSSNTNTTNNNFPAPISHRYSSTSFNFSSSDQPNSFTSLPSTWGNGYLNYGSNNQFYKQNQILASSLNLGRQTSSGEQIYQPFNLIKNNPSPPRPSTTSSSHQMSLTDTIAAATKAITSDPSFQSALASAITSIVGGGSGGGGENIVLGKNLKWGDQIFPAISTSTHQATTSNGTNGCTSNYLNRSSKAEASSSNNQQGNFMFLPSTLPFTSSKSTTVPLSPDEDHDKEHK